MTIQSKLEIFYENFGIKPDPDYDDITHRYGFIFAADPSHHIFLVDRTADWKFESSFKQYSIKSLPKLDKNNYDVLVYGDYVFGYRYFKDVVEKYKIRSLSLAISKHHADGDDGTKEPVYGLIIDLGECYILLLERKKFVEGINHVRIDYDSVKHLEVFKKNYERIILSDEILKPNKLKGLLML